MSITKLNIKQTVERNIAIKRAGYDYVYWGKRNVFPDYLNDLYYNSSKHNSILNAKIRYVAGNYDGSGDDRYLYEIFKKCVKDYILYGGCYVRPIKVGSDVKYEVLSPSLIRFDESKEFLYYGVYNIRNDIFKYTTNRNPVQSVVPIDEVKELKASSDLDLYPVPEYNGSLGFIEVDCRMSNYIANYLSNNLSAGYLVNVYGISNRRDEELEAISRQFINVFSGDDNAGKVIVQFPQDKDHATEITPIDINDVVDKLNMINDLVQKEIFVAHGVTSPMLFGLRVEGQLGGRNELVAAYELFKKTYILPTRYIILDWLSSIDSRFSALDITDEMPISLDVTQYVGILTTDEIREVLGYKPLNGGEVDSQDKVFDKLVNADGGKYDRIISTTDIDAPNDDKIFEAMRGVQKQSTDFTITAYHLKALNTIKTSPTIDIKTLSNYVGLSDSYTGAVVKDLIAKGYIIETDNGYFITKKGVELLASKNLTYTDVRYSYGWRDGFTDKDAKNSREFCVKLMNESKKRMAQNNLWTRAEIEKISQEVGRDVWSYRGGWYRVPNTTTNLPYCRHTWKQHIVIVKV